VVYYQDEVDIHLNPKVGRDWMLRGQQKVVVTPGENVKRCVAGALDPRRGEIIWAAGKRRDSELFLKLLRQVRAVNPSAKRIHIILDNAKAHLSLKARKALEEEFQGVIVLHFLPPYCPQENPIERLWCELHANVTRNHGGCKTIEQLMAHLERFLIGASPDPPSKPSLARAPTANVAKEVHREPTSTENRGLLFSRGHSPSPGLRLTIKPRPDRTTEACVWCRAYPNAGSRDLRRTRAPCVKPGAAPCVREPCCMRNNLNSIASS